PIAARAQQLRQAQIEARNDAAPLTGARYAQARWRASLSRHRSGYLLMRRIDRNPSVWLAFSPVVGAGKGRNSITPSINDPQINVRCKLIDDFEINFPVTYTIPKHVLCGLPNSPSIRMTKTQCVNG